MMLSAREGYTGGQVAAELDCGVELDCVKRCQSSERSSSLLIRHHHSRFPCWDWHLISYHCYLSFISVAAPMSFQKQKSCVISTRYHKGRPPPSKKNMSPILGFYPYNRSKMSTSPKDFFWTAPLTFKSHENDKTWIQWATSWNMFQGLWAAHDQISGLSLLCQGEPALF